MPFECGLVFLIGGGFIGFQSTPNGWGERRRPEFYSARLPKLSQFRRHPVKVPHTGARDQDDRAAI